VEQVLEFMHPVVRAAIYETLDVVERGAAHRRAAELLLDAGALPENAAAHLLRTPAAADPFVISTLRRAAERSLAQGAADASIEYLTRALDEQCDPEKRAEVLAELGFAERRINALAASDHLRAGLERLSGPDRRGDVALELGRALWFSDRLPEALAVFQEALQEVDRKRYPDLYERLVAELITAAWWQPETYPIAEAAIQQLDIDSLHGGFGSELLLATMSHYEYRLGADRDRAVELARRALASGTLLTSGVVALAYATEAFPIAGLLDDALAVYRDRLMEARRRGDILDIALTFMWRGQCQTFRGDLGAALADLREAFDLIVQHDVRVAWPYVTGFLVQALLERGDADEAARVIAEAGFPEQLPVNGHLIFFRLARGRLRIESAAPEQGVTELLQLGETVRVLRLDIPTVMPWRNWAARGLRLLGRGDEGRELVEEELASARRWGAPPPIGIALRTLGLLQGGSEGEQLLREAVDVLAPSPARLEHAKALIELGALLRRRNERSEAREFLRQGVDLAHACGARPLVERANEELAATGARPRKVVLSGLESLTASERRVAQLAAEELSNKEIAQALFVTVKTVEVHLSHVYRKLEIGSRRQLAAALVGPRAGEPVPAGA
jgi:DNA-binding CsgD family transcriptional regulator